MQEGAPDTRDYLRRPRSAARQLARTWQRFVRLRAAGRLGIGAVYASYGERREALPGSQCCRAAGGCAGGRDC